VCNTVPACLAVQVLANREALANGFRAVVDRSYSARSMSARDSFVGQSSSRAVTDTFPSCCRVRTQD
jgi:hypothetical protein